MLNKICEDNLILMSARKRKSLSVILLSPEEAFIIKSVGLLSTELAVSAEMAILLTG